MKNQTRPFRFALLLALSLGISGCKEVLYSDLSETDANAMVAILAASGVDASRSRDKKGIYELSVEGGDVATSIVILGERGYPKKKFTSLGEVFSADGIIGTPFEQHARFIHAMNEELSHTITAISGIREARVLITAPPKGRYERTPPPASASVTIHHDDGFDPTESVSKIKQIVSFSIANLNYDNVVVSAFLAGTPEITTPEITTPTAASEKSTAPISGGAPVPGIVSLPAQSGWLAQNGLVLKILGGLLLLAAAAIVFERRLRSQNQDAS